MRLKVNRLRASRRRSGEIRPSEEVQWQLAQDYADQIDQARADQNAKAYREAAAELERVLERVTPAEASGDPDRGAEPAGGADLYALPPVGHATDAD